MAPTAVVWTHQARADLFAALRYIVEQSPQAATTLLADVETAADSLAQLSERGARVSEVSARGRRVLADSLEHLRRAQDEIAARRHEGRGVQGAGILDSVSIGNLLIESVPIHVCVGAHEQALDVLGLVVDFFDPHVELSSRDPMLGPLRAHPDRGSRLAARLDELRAKARERRASRADAR